MIALDKTNAKIVFAHNDRRRRGKDFEIDLISGTKCSACSNVIFASFLTDKLIPLRPFEQTSIMHTRTLNDNGKFSHYSPTDEAGPDACNYEVTLDKFENKFIQTIRLKNHVLLPERANNLNRERMEVGERTCLMSGIVAMDKHLALQMALALTGSRVDIFSKLDYSNMDGLFASQQGLYHSGMRFEESYGSVPMSVILIPKDKVENNLYFYPNATLYRKG